MDPTSPNISYRVAVKALCQFTAKGGDLDRRFTPAPSSREGIAGHAIVASRRGPAYRTEVALSAEEGSLHVRGRADGFLPASQRLEEIKTHRGPVERIPENHRVLHWAQLQTYGALLCLRDGLDTVTLGLVYFNVETQQETMFEEVWSAAALRALFCERCRVFAAWAQSEIEHRERRDASLRVLQFPFRELHAQQRLLAEAVYRAAMQSTCLLAEAPTGVGKTLGTLFPLLKAVGARKLDKVFYLTAKSTGRALALDALAQLQEANPQSCLRVLDLVARDKACVYPDRQCHGGSCPLARGFYDRLSVARAAAIDAGSMRQDSLRAVALAHDVCPYYLCQELVRWADVIIADYNHYFDSSAMLHALLCENGWEVGVLIDEAHNLLPRARQMYSATLSADTMRAALDGAPAALRSTLNRIRRFWDALIAGQPPTYIALDRIPESLVQALKDAVTRLSDWSITQVEPLPPVLQQFHFAALDFLRLKESLAEHSLLDWAGDDSMTGATLNIRNIVPACFLAERFAAAKTTILFSATLSPRTHYQDMLGLADCRCLTVGSPFAAEQLDVRLVADVSTRFRDRARSLSSIIALVVAQFERHPGNYLLFAGSFEYLQQIETELRRCCPVIPVWVQTSGMTERDRNEFTARFTIGSCGIGLAVLGGSFAEGIDLPGARLIGAFILTLGLPAISPLNEEIRRRLQASGGSGYERTYLYPGIQRVVQAAGRVIRSPSDRGVLYLFDDRFSQPEVAQLLPSWWAVKTVHASSSRVQRA